MARRTQPGNRTSRRPTGGATAGRAPQERKPGAEKRKPSLRERVADLLFEGPGDLSTNPKYLEGFGQPNRPAGGASSRPAGRKSLPELFAESPLTGLSLKVDRD